MTQGGANSFNCNTYKKLGGAGGGRTRKQGPRFHDAGQGECKTKSFRRNACKKQGGRSHPTKSLTTGSVFLLFG
jgi:hypothetical protein